MSKSPNHFSKLNKMAKTKKVLLKKKKLDNKVIKKSERNNNKEQQINLNCVVKLENIDHLLRKYKISNEPSDVHQQDFDIDIQINKNKLIVRGQQLLIENDKTEFHLEIQIKNDNLMFKFPDQAQKCDSTQTEYDEIALKSPRPQRTAIITKTTIAKDTIDVKKKTMEPLAKFQRTKTIAELANDAWKLCKFNSKRTNIPLEIGQFVMAKMKSYAPWAAKITGFTQNRKKAYVYFYGTHNSGSVEVNEIILFQDSDQVIRMLLLRHLDCFSKGIKEIEIELGIPVELSITNRNTLNDN